MMPIEIRLYIANTSLYSWYNQFTDIFKQDVSQSNRQQSKNIAI